MLRAQNYIGKDIILGVRPEDIHDEPLFLEAAVGSKFIADIEVSELTGAELMLYSKVGEQEFVARVDARSDIKAGQQVELAFDMNKCHFFDVENEQRIR